jgi:hypothetical protein
MTPFEIEIEFEFELNPFGTSISNSINSISNSNLELPGRQERAWN